MAEADESWKTAIGVVVRQFIEEAMDAVGEDQVRAIEDALTRAVGEAFRAGVRVGIAEALARVEEEHGIVMEIAVEFPDDDGDD